MTEPAVRLKMAVSSLRTVGTVFVILGGLAAAAVWHDGANSVRVLPFVVTSSLLWVGPGVLYHLTAVLIRRHDVRMAVLARRTAVAQSALAVVAVVGSYATGRFGGPYGWAAVMPATVTVFFVPALLAQAFQIGKALDALRHLSMPGHGFEVRPMPVVDDGEGERPI